MIISALVKQIILHQKSLVMLKLRANGMTFLQLLLRKIKLNMQKDQRIKMTLIF